MKMSRFVKAGSILILAGCLMFSSTQQVEAVRSVTAIEKEKKALQKEIDKLDNQLYALVLQVEELTAQIADTEAEIESTQIALADAQVACAEQYEAMKIRIQYMYEKPETSVLEMLLESGSISSFLNRLEYVNGVYDYDREKLDQFQATQAEIEELAIALDQQLAELETQKADLKEQQKSLDAMLATKSATMKDLDKELKEAKEIARREAALRAALLAAQRARSSASSSYNLNGNLNPPQITGISGYDVVNYANQFVGGRYVWGGNNLSTGVDCSGFVQGVYANFGITWGVRMTSASFRNVGQEVSYNYMQAGDLVCYPGHIGIYMGNGQIVEAQSTATGITNYRSVNCHPIITIRRVI